MPSPVSPSSPQSSDAAPPDVKALAVVLRDEFDIPFRFYDVSTGDLVVMPSQGESASAVPSGERELALSLGAEAPPKVVAAQAGRYLIAFPLNRLGLSHLVAVGVMIALARTG